MKPWIQYSQAEKWYQIILKTFNFDQKKDINARNLLYSLKKRDDPQHLIFKISQAIRGRNLLFFGAGPNLMQHLTKINHGILKNRQKYYLIAADGSANALKMVNLIPDLITTDLDGLTNNEIQYFLERDTILVIHGHGDNIEKIQSLSSIIQSSKNIISTTQTSPKYPIINPGGFTDGDRGLYLLHHLSNPDSTFLLFGYEFKDQIGAFSKKGLTSSTSMSHIKKKKMDLCFELIMHLQNAHNRRLYLFGSHPLDDLRVKQSIQKGF